MKKKKDALSLLTDIHFVLKQMHLVLHVLHNYEILAARYEIEISMTMYLLLSGNEHIT